MTVGLAAAGGQAAQAELARQLSSGVRAGSGGFAPLLTRDGNGSGRVDDICGGTGACTPVDGACGERGVGVGGGAGGGGMRR
jgi:hypothetical protein